MPAAYPYNADLYARRIPRMYGWGVGTQGGTEGLLGQYMTYVGTGGGASADNRISDFIDKIDEAIALYEAGNIEEAIGTLKAVLKKCDGDPKPPDHVEGDAAVELANRILDLIEAMEEEL